MSYIEKGIVLTIEGEPDRNENMTQARVQSMTAEGTTTLPLTIPWYLRGSMGMLEKGTEVVYALFDDATGVILSRMDGNWNGRMEESQLFIDLMGATATLHGSVEISKNTTVDKLTGNRIVDSGVRLATHTHSIESGGSSTGKPNGGSQS